MLFSKYDLRTQITSISLYQFQSGPIPALKKQNTGSGFNLMRTVGMNNTSGGKPMISHQRTSPRKPITKYTKITKEDGDRSVSPEKEPKDKSPEKVPKDKKSKNFKTKSPGILRKSPIKSSKLKSSPRKTSDDGPKSVPSECSKEKQARDLKKTLSLTKDGQISASLTSSPQKSLEIPKLDSKTQICQNTAPKSPDRNEEPRSPNPSRPCPISPAEDHSPRHLSIERRSPRRAHSPCFAINKYLKSPRHGNISKKTKHRLNNAQKSPQKVLNNQKATIIEVSQETSPPLENQAVAMSACRTFFEKAYQQLSPQAADVEKLESKENSSEVISKEGDAEKALTLQEKKIEKGDVQEGSKKISPNKARTSCRKGPVRGSPVKKQGQNSPRKNDYKVSPTRKTSLNKSFDTQPESKFETSTKETKIPDTSKTNASLSKSVKEKVVVKETPNKVEEKKVVFKKEESSLQEEVGQWWADSNEIVNKRSRSVKVNNEKAAKHETGMCTHNPTTNKGKGIFFVQYILLNVNGQNEVFLE